MKNIVYTSETNSTNSLMRQMVEADASLRELTLVYAGFQTSGRGQKGNLWQSERGKNICCSILLRPTSVPAAQQFVLSEAVSLGITDFLDRHHSGSLIKWPNDIYYGNHKVCGVLIENQIEGTSISFSIAGIGININQTHFPDDLPNPISLNHKTGIIYDLTALVPELRRDISARYRMLLTEAGRTLIHRDYLHRLYRFGVEAPYYDAGGHFIGKIIDVEVPGRIVIADQMGKVRKYNFKEVSFVI